MSVTSPTWFASARALRPAVAAVFVIAAVVSLAAAAPAATTATTVATTTPSSTTTPPSAITSIPALSASRVPSAATLACARAEVATWPLVEQANETIAVPVDATNVGAMGAAARDGFGALLLFGTTAPTVMGRIVARLQRLTLHHATMLVMTDEEGGGVARLTNLVSPSPWAQTMGRNLSAPQIEGWGRRVGLALARIGVNVDLAPVLDVDGRPVFPSATNPDGLRSFGGSPSLVATDGVAFATGLARAGVTPVVKHFPGLGGASRNTDFGPATTLAWSRLRRTGLVPFERAVAAGVPAVMIANASVPGFTLLPASLSERVVRELRASLDFRGLIIDDSLSAGAISALHLSPASAAVLAESAGVDLVLFGVVGSPGATLAYAREIAASLVRAVNTGRLSRASLMAAAAQVLATRSALRCPSIAVTSVSS